MKSNICLILFGVLIAHAVLSTAEKTEDNSLSEVASSRLARAANADPGRNKANKKTKKAKKATRRNKKSKKANRRNKKSKKANRKNRKSKKVDKKRRNDNKRKSKSKKAKKLNKKPNTKKEKKSRKNKSQKSALRQDIPEVCLTDAVKTLYNGLAKKASYFERQKKRIEKRVPIIANKLNKAGDYIQAANNMANIVPSCPADLVVSAEILSFELGTCEANITDSCQPPIYNQTKIDECTPIVDSFIEETEVCYNLTKDATGKEACGCWESKVLKDLFDDLADCNIKESEENVTARFQECKGAVSDCNKAETDAFPVYVNCSKNPIDDLKKKAELLANNINALSQAVTVIEKAAAARRRIIRAAATNCSDFIGLVEKRELFLTKC